MRCVSCFLVAAVTLFGCGAVSGGEDFFRCKVGDVSIEWIAFSGAYGHLDGPAREGMIRRYRWVEVDAVGNFYFFDQAASAVRCLRARDGRLFTLSGNGYLSFGRPREGGPAATLRLGSTSVWIDGTVAPVGTPLDGKGSLYVADPQGGVVVRLFRKTDGTWWYERVAGLGGGKKPADGTPAKGVSLAEPRVISTRDGGIYIAARTKRRAYTLFRLENGVLRVPYDASAVNRKVGGYFSCFGLDGGGNFVGKVEFDLDGKRLATPKVAVVSPAGEVKTVVTPWNPTWGVFPDRVRRCCYIRGMDDYTVNRLFYDGRWGILMRDGSWKKVRVANRKMFRPSRIKGVLNWSRSNPLLDGRYAGYDIGGHGPLFVASFGKGGGR